MTNQLQNVNAIVLMMNSADIDTNSIYIDDDDDDNDTDKVVVDDKYLKTSGMIPVEEQECFAFN